MYIIYILYIIHRCIVYRYRTIYTIYRPVYVYTAKYRYSYRTQK